MINIDNFKDELKNLFYRLKSKEVLVYIKEEFIERLIDDYKFDYLYSEEKKHDYFYKLDTYITFLKEGLNKQKIISNLSFDELYIIYYYYEEKSILEVLSDIVDYVESTYIEIDFIKKSITKKPIQKSISHDLKEINIFLKLYNYNK